MTKSQTEPISRKVVEYLGVRESHFIIEDPIQTCCLPTSRRQKRRHFVNVLSLPTSLLLLLVVVTLTLTLTLTSAVTQDVTMCGLANGFTTKTQLTSGSGWTCTGNNVPSANVCTWTGVTCDGSGGSSGSVVRISK
jgi:hypothetical protein